MEAITAAVLAWLLDAIQVIGPLVTIAIVLWARSLIAKLSARSTTAEIEIESAVVPMTSVEKHEAARARMKAVPLVFRQTLTGIDRHVKAAVEERKSKRESAPPRPPDEAG